MEPTPLQVSSYTHLLYKAQDPFSACRQSQVQNNFLPETILMKDQSLLHRSRNSGRDLLGGTNSFAGQLLHPSPVQSSRSIQCMQTVQVQNNFLSQAILMKDQSLLHRSRNSGRDLLGGTNSFAGQLLHPSPVQSSRSIQRMQTVPGPKQFSARNNFDEGPVFASQIKKLGKRFIRWNQLLCRSALTPISSCTKLKIHSVHADSRRSKTIFFLKQF